MMIKTSSLAAAKGIGAILLLSLLIGCASFVNGTTQEILVTSSPPGAHVTLGGNQFITPTSIRIKRNRDYLVLVQKEGFQPQIVKVKRELSYWWWADLFIIIPAPAIGTSIDEETGKMTDETSIYPMLIGLILVGPLEWARVQPSDWFHRISMST